MAAVLARFAHRFGEAGLACQADLDPDLGARVDQARFTQLLENLCENCCRYVTSPGHIDVRLERVGTQARLTVADSGPGVGADDRARLFEPLHRAEPSRSRRHGGAGLGLALCQRIVQAHGGAITAATSAAGGLAIVVTLPLAEA